MRVKEVQNARHPGEFCEFPFGVGGAGPRPYRVGGVAQKRNAFVRNAQGQQETCRSIAVCEPADIERIIVHIIALVREDQRDTTGGRPSLKASLPGCSVVAVSVDDQRNVALNRLRQVRLTVEIGYHTDNVNTTQTLSLIHI